MITPSKIRTWWIDPVEVGRTAKGRKLFHCSDSVPDIGGALKVVALSDIEPILEALREANDALSGMCHTNFPINVRELDGSISQVRPESAAGRAYKITKAALAIWDGAGDE